MYFNAILTKMIKIYKKKLTNIFSPQNINLPNCFVFQERFKLFELTKGLIFSLRKNIHVLLEQSSWNDK